MQEYTSPVLVSIDGYRNVTDLLMERVKSTPDLAAFEIPDVQGASETWREVSVAQFEKQVREVARGLIASGVESGQPVIVMSHTRYEWAVIESAIWFAGGVVVPIYDTSSVAQTESILRDTQAQIAFAGSREQAATLRAAANLSNSKIAIYEMDSRFEELLELDPSVTIDSVEARRIVAKKTDVATIVYTSGTTGDPKGALITHQNLLGQVLNIAAAYTGIIWEGGRTIIFLPLAHVLARGLQLVCLASGMKIAHLSEPKKVVPALAVLKPTFLVVVPRVLQKIQAAASLAARKKRMGKLWQSAVHTAVEWANHLEKKTKPPRALKAKHAVFDKIFFKRLRNLMGGEVGYLLSGAAALEPDLARFYRGIGVPVVEGYGLTETTAPLTGNLPGAERAGSVGIPTPGSTVRISEQGEVLAKGIGVFAGYRNPLHNVDAFVDGFFRTGDLGELDQEGRLTLKGRIKDVIVTSGGKTVIPAAWENLVESNPLVAHAIAVGDGKPYLSSLIVVDPDALSSWASEQGEEEIVRLASQNIGKTFEIDNVKLREAIERTIRHANEQFSRSEQVRKFTVVVADLTASGGNITATMKLKRRVFLDKVSSIVERLYSEPAQGGRL